MANTKHKKHIESDQIRKIIRAKELTQKKVVEMMRGAQDTETGQTGITQPAFTNSLRSCEMSDAYIDLLAQVLDVAPVCITEKVSSIVPYRFHELEEMMDDEEKLVSGIFDLAVYRKARYTDLSKEDREALASLLECVSMYFASQKGYLNLEKPITDGALLDGIQAIMHPEASSGKEILSAEDQGNQRKKLDTQLKDPKNKKKLRKMDDELQKTIKRI